MWNLLRTASGFVLALAIFDSAVFADQKVTHALDNDVNAYLAAADAKPSDNTLHAYWKNGLRLDTADKSIQLKIGGRIMYDFGFQSADREYHAVTGSATIADDYAFPRRARLYMEGTIHNNVIFKAQYDFGKSEEVAIKDLFIGIQEMALGALLIGHFKTPVSLEDFTSSKYTTFIERSAATQAFAPGRKVGIGFTDKTKSERIYWSYGVFRPSDPDSASVADNKGYMFVARVTGLAIQGKTASGAPHLLHLGVSGQFRSNGSGQTTQFRARGTAGIGDRAIDTGTIAAEESIIFGFEIAWVRGPLSVQGEFYLADVSAIAGNPDPSFTGYYVQVSYWVTGESRKYKRSSFNRVKPTQNAFDGSGGLGAWELAVRFDSTDLNDVDHGVNGNEWTGITVGVNWHWNPNTRVMINYVHGNADDTLIDGTIDSIMFRLQVDF